MIMKKISIYLLLVLFLKEVCSSLYDTLLDPQKKESVEKTFGYILTQNFNSMYPGMIAKFEPQQGFEFFETEGGYFFDINAINYWQSIQKKYQKTIKMKLLNKSIIYYALQTDQNNGKYDNMNCVFMKGDQFEDIKSTIDLKQFSQYVQSYKVKEQVLTKVCKRIHRWIQNFCQNQMVTVEKDYYDYTLCFNKNNGVSSKIWDLLKAHYLKKFGSIPQDILKQIPDYGFELNSYCIPYCKTCLNHLKCIECDNQFVLSSEKCAQCNEFCNNCTEANNNKKCVKCSEKASLFQGECLSKCPESYYNEKNICLQCQEGCQSCISAVQCQKCKKGYFLQDNSCVTYCHQGSYYDEITMSCQLCHQSCSQCTGPQNSQCQSCSENYCLNDGNTCLPSCNLISGSSAFCNSSSRICQSCDKSCLECNGLGPKMCTQCQISLFRQNPDQVNTICVEQCQDEKVPDSNNNCQTCQPPCKTCRDFSIENCLSCIEGYYLHNNKQCLQKCPEGFIEQEGKCFQFDANCKIFSDDKKSFCQECQQGYVTLVEEGVCVKYFEGFKCSQDFYLFNQNQCLRRCPNNYFADSLTQQCQKQCSQQYYIYDDWLCIQCQDKGMKVQDTKCVNECSQGYYLNKSVGECFKCHQNCLDCSGSLSNNCLSCKEPQILTEKNECEQNQSCFVGEFYNKQQEKCEKCHSSCSVCDSNLRECIYCNKSYKYYYEKANSKVECLVNCNKKGNQTIQFLEQTFYQCLEGSKDQANNHITGLVIDLNGSFCLQKRASDQQCQKCKKGYFLQDSKCLPCYFNCSKCYGPNQNQCQRCYQGSVDKDNICYQVSPFPSKPDQYQFESGYSYKQLEEKYKTLEMPPLKVAKEDFQKREYKDKIFTVSNLPKSGCLLTAKSIILANLGLKIAGELVNPSNLYDKIINDSNCYGISLQPNKKIKDQMIYSAYLKDCKIQFDQGTYLEVRDGEMIQIEEFKDYVKRANLRQRNGEKLFYLIQISGVTRSDDRIVETHFLLFKQMLEDNKIEAYDVGSALYYNAVISLKNLSQEENLKLGNAYKKLKIVSIREVYFQKVLSSKESLKLVTASIKYKDFNKQSFINIKKSLQKIYLQNPELKTSCEKDISSLKFNNLTEQRQVLLIDLCYLSQGMLIKDIEFISKVKQFNDNNETKKFNTKIKQTEYFNKSDKQRQQLLLKLMDYNSQ